MKGKIIIIIMILILIGMASYFYSYDQNRYIMQGIYRDVIDLEFFIDYRERHLFLYTNRFMILGCKDLNNTECKQYLSTFGWKLYGDSGSRVRLNSEILDELLISLIDNFNRIWYGFKVMFYDFGFYTKIWVYKAEVLSKRGLDPLYFPEPYRLQEQLFKLKLDIHMKDLIDTPEVIGLIYYDVLVTACKGWISGVWLLFYFVVDETMIQLIVASFLANFLVFITKEFMFIGVNKLSGGTVKFWMFQKYTSLLQEIGLLDVFNNAMAILIMIRVIFIMIGLPYLFNLGALYSLMLVLAYCFWYVITHVQHKIKYEVELKIKADIGMKKATRVEFSFYTFMERIGLWFLRSFWTMAPLPVRLYRQGFDFRPFKDLIAPSKFRFYCAICSLVILIPVTFVFDIVFHTLSWTFCYLWLYPYVFNRRISETKWLEIIKSIEDRSVIINSEELLERDDYFYNLIRSYLLIFGFYRMNGELILKKSMFSEFMNDVKQSNPDNNMQYWTKIYEMPIRYLKDKFLHHHPTMSEKFELYSEGLERDAYSQYGRRDIRLLWTKGSKDINALNSVKSVIDSLFLKKFGVRWTPSLPLPDYEEPEGSDYSEDEEGRFKGNYIHVRTDFNVLSPESGFSRFVVKHFNGNKMASIATELVQKGEVPYFEGLQFYESLFLLSYVRYTAMYFYEEDIKDIREIKGINEKYYIEGVTKADYCKTVCLSACIMADADVVVQIKQSLYTKNIVLTRDPVMNHFISDAYYRLSLLFEEEIVLEEEDEGLEFEILDYKRVELPEYKDFTELAYGDLTKKLAKITEVKGSILTQLGHLKKQVHNKELDRLYKLFSKKLKDLEGYMVYPVFETGEIQSDIALSQEFVMLLHTSLSVDNEIYVSFRMWLSHFKEETFPLVLAWFVQNNKTFLFRYIPKETLNDLYRRGGLDKHKTWFQPDSRFELKKKQIHRFIDQVRNKLEPIILTKEDDDYIELKDIRDPLMDLSYSNMSSLTYTVYNNNVFPGLKTLGVQRDYSCADIMMYVNKDMVNYVRTFSPSANLAEYVIANPNKDLIFNALDKYRRRGFEIKVTKDYQGINMYDWIDDILDRLYNVDKTYSISVREIDSFSIEDLSLQSRKASPGFLTNRSGVKNKADKLDMTKAWAKTYRKSILVDQPLEHIWTMLVVPKTCKPGAEEVRVVNAPEMYFYINQFLIFEEFINLSKKSKVTNDFCLFFGDFDRAVRKHTSGYQLESLDLRSQGGRIQREVKDIFIRWYGKFLKKKEDKLIFEYLINDIFKCKFMIPSNYGGFIFEKEDGWCDGPYGTNQFDSWTMVVYYLINVWVNVVETASDLTIVKPELFNIESHGDNWIHSYPESLEKIFSWRPSTLHNLGQEVKGTISKSVSPIGLELMGFEIHLRDGLYVGTRSLGKTLKSLIFNKRKYRDKNTQKEYEKSIISCLRLVDCWNTEAFELLNKLEAKYASVRPKAITADDEHKLYILEEMDNQPRRAWTYESKRIMGLEEADPTNLSLWIEKD